MQQEYYPRGRPPCPVLQHVQPHMPAIWAEFMVTVVVGVVTGSSSRGSSSTAPLVTVAVAVISVVVATIVGTIHTLDHASITARLNSPGKKPFYS